MTGVIGSQDTELRKVIDQQITDLETAIVISEEAAWVDRPAPDGDPFATVLTSDVLSLIGDEMAAGRVTEGVIYFIARHSIHELQDQLCQLREQKTEATW